MKLTSPIREIKGIGEKTEHLFHKLGVYSVSDMLLSFPRAYLSYPKPVSNGLFRVNETCAFLASPMGKPMTRRTGKMQISTCNASDGYVKIQMIWYRMPYIGSTLSQRREWIFYGKITAKGGRFLMEQPKVYTPEQYEVLMHTMQPLYPLTAGLKLGIYQKAVKSVLDRGITPDETLPSELLRRYKFPAMSEAIKQIHFPDNEAKLENARKRFAYEEFLLFLLGIRLQKNSLEQVENAFPINDFSMEDKLIAELPYTLTEGQKSALSEIHRDISGPRCMQRLLQGDVGSGKTIIAFLTMINFAYHGYQSALMAPTEVLAEQHYHDLSEYIESHNLPYRTVLLIGSMSAGEKKKVRALISGDEPCLVIGTHALIQESVSFGNLGLVITDEQHRFGVMQRDKLAQKGAFPHILVMSATPIPRSLALILYGDLDVSLMRGLPNERLPIRNFVISTTQRNDAYKRMYGDIREGHQCYVICPLIEESEGMDACDVLSYANRLREVFPEEVKIGILHGRMKPDDKNQIMQAFAANEIQILISTTVIEVGINVPNATVMLIEDAQRFGLAQLHQLRGRIGRGKWQSRCLLVNSSDDEKSKERLEILQNSNDGFDIAEQDLKLRGPGEYFGTQQSGELSFTAADLYEDSELLKKASTDAAAILEVDPDLTMDAHKGLADRLSGYMKERQNLAGL